jgi:hypothetical protein
MFRQIYRAVIYILRSARTSKFVNKLAFFLLSIHEGKQIFFKKVKDIFLVCLNQRSLSTRTRWTGTIMTLYIRKSWIPMTNEAVLEVICQQNQMWVWQHFTSEQISKLFRRQVTHTQAVLCFVTLLFVLCIWRHPCRYWCTVNKRFLVSYYVLFNKRAAGFYQV